MHCLLSGPEGAYTEAESRVFQQPPRDLLNVNAIKIFLVVLIAKFNPTIARPVTVAS